MILPKIAAPFGAGGNTAFGTQSPGMGSLFGGAASGSAGTTGSNLFGTNPASSFGQPQNTNAFCKCGNMCGLCLISCVVLKCIWVLLSF